MTEATATAINRGVWRDAYDLYAGGFNRLGEPDLWDGFFWPRAEAICAKHEKNQFCIEMLIAVHSELERAQRELKCGR